MIFRSVLRVVVSFLKQCRAVIFGFNKPLRRETLYLITSLFTLSLFSSQLEAISFTSMDHHSIGSVRQKSEVSQKNDDSDQFLRRDILRYIEYFPFGEMWVSERASTNATPYLFSGKELDEDTQLYAFPARYYDPRTSVWQSADPAFEDYLDGQLNEGVFNPININPYRYAALNPLAFIDPNGEFEATYGEDGSVTGGTVEKGDTLFGITKSLKPSNQDYVNEEIAKDIANKNSIKNPDLILPGQKLDFTKLHQFFPDPGALADPGLADPSAYIRGVMFAGLAESLSARAAISGMKKNIKMLDSHTLQVLESHFKDITKVFQRYHGKLNLRSKEFWQHVLPHKHIYRAPYGPLKNNANLRKRFVQSGATKETFWPWQ